MRRSLGLWSIALGLVALGAAVAAGCASGNQQQGSNSLGGGGAGPGAGGSVHGSGGSSNHGGGLGVGGGGTGGKAPSCADFTEEAKALPAAMVFLLDMSASMRVKVPPNTGTAKYLSAEQAIVTAIDEDAFDNTAIGLMIFPDSTLPRPPCCTECPPQVSCGLPMTPQIPPADSGTLKSTAMTGVRHTIASVLQSSQPNMDFDDGTPGYLALQAAYSALQAYSSVDKRFAIVITDGGFSCTSISMGARPGYSDGECPDWEYPDTVNTLISGAYNDAMTPINTFAVGVPGSNTLQGSHSGIFANAPYSVLLALSTYAVSGSPNTVDPSCDKNLVFTQGGAPPNFPCHIDLSNGNQFTADALAQAIAKVRGQALGCTYDLPDPPPGKTINPDLVNVILTLNGMPAITVPRRTNSNDMCTTADCWDYNAMNQVQLIGKACSDLTAATMSKIEIEVGCKTILN